MEKENFNNWVEKEQLNKWHKIDKNNFTPPPTNTNILFFSEGGSVFCGHYKNTKGFVCYGINARELTDVEITHWRIIDFPIEFQQRLDNIDKLPEHGTHECPNCNWLCSCNTEPCNCCK